MIITTNKGKIIDTADLSPEERHILQKLFAWAAVADSLTQFRKIKNRAMKTGWNNSGPVQESRIVKIIIQYLERELIQRLKKENLNKD
jgi:hypothetical protein